MMLNEEQTNAVKHWVADGAGISDVQSKLKDEFGIVMTYMDVRFLIDDLDAELVSPQPVVEETNQDVDDITVPLADEDSLPTQEQSEMYDASLEVESDSMQEEQQISGVKVSVSPIQRPDCVISGDVEFSDGSKAEWRIDRMGQLGLIPSNPNMNPPQSDIIEFQRQLQSLLR